MWIMLKCPSCGIRRNYNGRGACTCKAYLVHSFAGRTLEVPRRAWRWVPDPSGPYTATYDDGGEERGKWLPLRSATYELPDGRRRVVRREPFDPLKDKT